MFMYIISKFVNSNTGKTVINVVINKHLDGIKFESNLLVIGIQEIFRGVIESFVLIATKHYFMFV